MREHYKIHSKRIFQINSVEIAVLALFSMSQKQRIAITLLPYTTLKSKKLIKSGVKFERFSHEISPDVLKMILL